MDWGDTAWENAVLRAHGIAPTRDPKTHWLTAEARAEYRRINLTFHDLRHEGASRLLEQGWALHKVSVMLGHKNIATTSRHLNVDTAGLLDEMRRTDASRGAPLQTVQTRPVRRRPRRVPRWPPSAVRL